MRMNRESAAERLRDINRRALGQTDLCPMRNLHRVAITTQLSRSNILHGAEFRCSMRGCKCRSERILKAMDRANPGSVSDREAARRNYSHLRRIGRALE